MGNCACCQWLNNFLWRNKNELLEYDHLKPAPYISHMGLVYLRLFLAVVMIATAITNAVITGWASLRFFDDWGLYLTMILFVLMAVAQIKNQKQMNAFQINVRSGSFSERHSGPDEQVDLLEQERQETQRQNNPWKLWKWIIFWYQMSFTFILMIFLVFWICYGLEGPRETRAERDYAHNFNSVWMHTLPAICLLIEYPFNSIPVSWPMLPFDLAICVLYGLLNFICYTITDTPVYAALDWYNHTGQAIWVYLLSLAIETLVFAALYFFTQKIKLVKFKEMSKRKISTLSSVDVLSFNGDLNRTRKESTQGSEQPDDYENERADSLQYDASVGHFSINLDQQGNPTEQ